jgi:uncharacterized membrane protein
MTTYAFIVLLAQAIGLALACAAIQPRALRTVWSAAACLAGALLGLSFVGVLAVTALAALLTWPVRRAWA